MNVCIPTYIRTQLYIYLHLDVFMYIYLFAHFPSHMYVYKSARMFVDVYLKYMHICICTL